MSIFASYDAPDEWHPEDCAIWVEVESGAWEMKGTCDCKMRDAPIIYQGSHVLPSDDDPRGGYIDLACIPNHITRDDRPELPEGALKDWLRFGVNGATVILTRHNVERVVASLTSWLERKPDPVPPSEEGK